MIQRGIDQVSAVSSVSVILAILSVVLPEKTESNSIRLTERRAACRLGLEARQGLMYRALRSLGIADVTEFVLLQGLEESLPVIIHIGRSYIGI